MFKTILSFTAFTAAFSVYSFASASSLRFETVSPADTCLEERADQNIYFKGASCAHSDSVLSDLALTFATKYGYNLSEATENHYPILCFEQNTGEIFIRKNGSGLVKSGSTNTFVLKPLNANSLCRSGTYRCVLTPDYCYDRLVFEFTL